LGYFVSRFGHYIDKYTSPSTAIEEENFLTKIYPFISEMSTVFQEYHPNSYNLAMQISSKFRIYKDMPFTTLYFNFYGLGDGCKPHVDSGDLENSSTILAIGNYRSGELANITTRQIFPLSSGQCVCINSKLCLHAVYPVTFGDRISVIAVVKEFILKLGRAS
jgi:hypothetical protein